MTHQLPSREVDLLRSLKKTAIVLMVLFRLDMPLGECEIAAILDLNLETVRSYLRSLARSGLVTRTHRFHGWILTAGGRQMVLGERYAAGYMESGNRAENIKTTAEIPRWSAENPRSLPEIAANAGASAENPPSSAENPRSLPASPAASGASAEYPRSTAEIPRLSAENPPSAPIAAASLSLNSLSLKAEATAAIAAASAENPPSTAEIPRSRSANGVLVGEAEGRTAKGSGRSDTGVQANLEALASIGVVQNEFILGICQMDHVTPGYIFGQKKRLEAERRYSPGLLLRVIQCRDDLPEKYVVGEESDPPQPPLKGGEINRAERSSRWPRPLVRGEKRRAQLLEEETEFEAEEGGLEIEPDSSVYEPLSAGGMTAARAWAAVRRELQRDMPRAAYDRFARDAVLLSARGGTFVIGAQSGYARDWLEGRLTSTITRLLAGLCNRSMEVRFVDLAAAGQSGWG